MVEAAALSRTGAAKQWKAAQHQRKDLKHTAGCKSPQAQSAHLLRCLFKLLFELITQHLCVSQALSARSAQNPQINGIEQIRARTWGIFTYMIIPSWKPIGCVLVFCI